MSDTHGHLCPAGAARFLDHGIRRLLQNPLRLLAPFVREGMTALDFGCGPGFFTLDLARLVGPSGHVIAADVQAAMLERLRAKLHGTALEPRLTLYQCQPGKLGLPLSFDFALAFWVLHELPDQHAFFAELLPLLRPAGRLLIVEPPLHVSRAAFASTVRTAVDLGFVVVQRPSIPFNKAALLGPAERKA